MRSAVRTVVLGRFNPLLAFASAADGWYYDFTDRNSMTQVSDGTGGVPAPGDPIGLVRDKSPFGHNSTQATAGSRPLWKTDGGLIGAEFDGTDDFLTGGDACDLRTNSIWIVMAVKINGNAGGVNYGLVNKSLAGSRIGRYGFEREPGGSGLEAIYQNSAGTVTQGGADTSIVARVLTVRLNRTAGSIQVYANRVPVGSVGSFTPDTGQDLNTTSRLLHGAINDGSDTGILWPLSGRIVASLGVIATTIDDRLVRGVERAFAAKVGVTLP